MKILMRPWSVLATLAIAIFGTLSTFSSAFTKTYTAALMLRLADQGLVHLEDNLTRWLPECDIPHASRITLRQLLHHTSGVSMPDSVAMKTYLGSKPQGPFPATELVELISKRPPFFDGPVKIPPIPR